MCECVENAFQHSAHFQGSIVHALKTVSFWQPLWQPHAWLKSDIASPHGDEQKENERRKEGEGRGSWFHSLRGELALHESELE